MQQESGWRWENSNAGRYTSARCIAQSAACLAGVLAGTACSDNEWICTEDTRAQVLPMEDFRIGEFTIRGEHATTQVEVERGWRFRLCNRSAIWLDFSLIRQLGTDYVPALDMCGVPHSIDAFWLDGDKIVAEIRGIPPCDESCSNCPRYLPDVPFTGILETSSNLLPPLKSRYASAAR